MENLNFKTEDEKTIRKKEHSLFLAIAATAVAVIVLAIIGFISIKPAQQIVQGQVDGTNVRVSGLMPGRVEKFYVHEGQIVHKGDTLARLRVPLSTPSWLRLSPCATPPKPRRKKPTPERASK